jgi:MFS family permease
LSNASQPRRVQRVALGNALEMNDFQIFGYYAPAIAATFFPNSNAFASLMLSLATFGAGFLMRPIGAVILGAYIDHRGRRAGLLLTLGLMGIGTLSMACLPGYATLGIAAPLLVLAGRLLQGFSAGVELGGAKSSARCVCTGSGTSAIMASAEPVAAPGVAGTPASG